MKSANAWLTYVRNTYILWADDNQRIGRIVSGLRDLIHVFSHRIPHLKSHRRLHLDLPWLSNDQRLTVDIDYQYIHVMRRIILYFNRLTMGNHDTSVIVPRFYWYKGLFCKGNLLPAIVSETTISLIVKLIPSIMEWAITILKNPYYLWIMTRVKIIRSTTWLIPVRCTVRNWGGISSYSSYGPRVWAKSWIFTVVMIRILAPVIPLPCLERHNVPIPGNSSIRRVAYRRMRG